MSRCCCGAFIAVLRFWSRPLLRPACRDLARESGFASVKDLLEMAQHGPGRNLYLIRFHYLPPGAWDRKTER